MVPTEERVDGREVGVSGTDSNSWPRDSLPDGGTYWKDGVMS